MPASRCAPALTGERLRTVLTLLGIMIGSGAIVLVVGLVFGAEVALVAANQSVSGSELVQVRAKDLPPWSIFAGFGLSVLAGLVAGLLPAMRAARLDPVVALRTE